MDKFRKQLAVNDFLFWLRRKYGQEITEMALQHEMDVGRLGKFEAERLLEERVKLLFDNIDESHATKTEETL